MSRRGYHCLYWVLQQFVHWIAKEAWPPSLQGVMIPLLFVLTSSPSAWFTQVWAWNWLMVNWSKIKESMKNYEEFDCTDGFANLSFFLQQLLLQCCPNLPKQVLNYLLSFWPNDFLSLFLVFHLLCFLPSSPVPAITLLHGTKEVNITCTEPFFHWGNCNLCWWCLFLH